MDAAADPNPPPSTDPAPASFSNEYWNGISSLYPSAPSHEEPFGIGWDHPVFQTPQAQSSDLYTHPQQTWHQSPLQHTVLPEPHQVFDLPNQYQIAFQQQQQSQQQPSSQHQPQQQAAPQPRQQQPPIVTYDSSQQTPAYPAYPFDNSYYSPLPPASYAPQASVDLQRTALRPGGSSENQQPTYSNTAIQQNIQPRPGPYPNEYTPHPTHANYHNTIDPQFLTASRHSLIPPEQTQRNIFVVNPADLERPSAVRNFQIKAEYSKPALLPAPSQNLTQIKQVKNGKHCTILRKTAHRSNLHFVAPAISKVERPLQPRLKKESPVRTKPLAKNDPARTPRKQGQPLSDSSDSSGSELNEPPEASPLPPSRPTDPDGNIKYDAMKIVWFPRNRHPSAPAVRNAMVLFSDLVKGVRDVWKSRSEALKAAENQGQEDKIPAIKREVIMQRRYLDIIINIALSHGHPAYIQRFGEHPITVSAFYSFLLDRHTAADSDGPLTVNILKLMSKFTTMDQATLEKTKNDKILTRFVKKGGDTIKKLAQIVLDNAALAAKTKTESSKPSSKETTPQLVIKKEAVETSDNPYVLIRNALPQNSKKRPRELEEKSAQTPKRVVSPPNVKNSQTSLPANLGVSQRSVGPANDSRAVPLAPTTKPKANIVTPKPTPSLFSSLMSASKKPGTSNAARAAAAAAAKEKSKVEQETPRAPPRPMFSFSETLADLSKPKPVVSTKPVEERPPETEEERKKRLKKEERRKLRVSWKPDDSLVEIRLFTHDPEEDIGRDDSARRDVSDLAGEGRTLKMHRGLDDLDDDDEDDMLPYNCPFEIDFAMLEPDCRERNFFKTGGRSAPASATKEQQDQREASTLSVFYTSPDDIPCSPKEPPGLDKEEETYEPEDDFGQPNDQVKARSAKYFAAMAGITMKTSPVTTQPGRQAPTAAPGLTHPQTAAQMDISTLLKVLQGNQVPQQQHQPQPQSNMSDLEKIFDKFRDPNQPPTRQTGQLPPSMPAPSAQGLDWQKLLNVMNLQQQMQPSVFSQAQPSQGPDLAAVLAQLSTPASSQQGQQQQQHQPQQISNQQSATSQQCSTPYENPERKRYRESGIRPDAETNTGQGKRFKANGEPVGSKRHGRRSRKFSRRH
ncbi:hypothetical protein LOZ12_005997 [Ophidiomyces ophidiicola]|nr:hypothetical protein LOZ12_005997 [Ophidiomyces ophidiicola]